MQKFARLLIPPPYVQKGGCKKRGNCCYYLMIRRPKGLLGKLFLLWNTEFQGFFPRSDEVYQYEGNRVMVMGCRYLQKDGSCKHYHLRPMVCRKWPVIAHFGRPRILKGCGFRAEPRNKLRILK
jgi:Fe-S-cluster containining protein